MSAVAYTIEYRDPAVYWARRLENWAASISDGLHLGYSQLALGTTPSGSAPDERDAEEVEALMVKMRREMNPIYRACWQCFVMRRDNITAAEALRIGVREYHGRLDIAYRWLERQSRSA